MPQEYTHPSSGYAFDRLLHGGTSPGDAAVGNLLLQPACRQSTFFCTIFAGERQFLRFERNTETPLTIVLQAYSSSIVTFRKFSLKEDNDINLMKQWFLRILYECYKVQIQRYHSTGDLQCSADHRLPTAAPEEGCRRDAERDNLSRRFS